MKKFIVYGIVLMGMFLGGCASIVETGKVILGTSIRGLEDARVDAARATFSCTFDECFDAVLDLQRSKMVEGGHFEVFRRNRLKGYLVVMGIKGNINTTEVGIFFSSRGYAVTVVEISSLSSSAERKVAEVVLAHLEKRFGQPSMDDTI